MNPVRKKRLYMVLGIVAGVAVAAGFALQAFNSSIGFRAPTEVVSGAVKPGKRFQIGGMVKGGSFERVPGTLEVHFTVTDFQNDVKATYAGVLPDLFKENSGVWAYGKLDSRGVFVADEVVAKHDENYMPPAVGKALKKGQSRLESSAPESAPQAN